jgi:hypothetical protein
MCVYVQRAFNTTISSRQHPNSKPMFANELCPWKVLLHTESYGTQGAPTSHQTIHHHPASPAAQQEE